MNLRDLGAELVKMVPGEALTFTTESVEWADAQGVMFFCPKCYAANGGARGTHMIVCWSRSRGAPEGMSPGPGRWRIDGTCIDDLTLNADAGGNGNRSVELKGGCNAHFLVNNGAVELI